MKAVPQRKLKAEMVMKDISLRKLAELSRVPYSQCSQILNGHQIHPEYFRRIKAAILKAPKPEEATAA